MNERFLERTLIFKFIFILLFFKSTNLTFSKKSLYMQVKSLSRKVFNSEKIFFEIWSRNRTWKIFFFNGSVFYLLGLVFFPFTNAVYGTFHVTYFFDYCWVTLGSLSGEEAQGATEEGEDYILTPKSDALYRRFILTPLIYRRFTFAICAHYKFLLIHSVQWNAVL